MLSEITTKGGSVINVQLKANLGDLNEVIVIGYGTTKKATLTGSVASVQVKKLQKRATKTLVNSLAGKLAGVRIVKIRLTGQIQYQL